MKTRNILFIGALATVIACSKNEDTKTSAASNVIEFEVSTDEITTKGEVVTTQKVYNDNYTKTFSLSAVKTSIHTDAGGIIVPESVLIEETNEFHDLLEKITGQKSTHEETAEYYFHGSEVFHNGHWYLDGKPTWPDGDKLSFWAVGHMIPQQGKNTSVQFYAQAYSNMKPLYGFEAYGLLFGIHIAIPDKNDCAQNQTDLLLAFDPNKSMADGKVKLHFKHVLSGVRFVLGDIPQDWAVSDIKIGNVLSTRQCVYFNIDWFDWRNCWTKENYDTEETLKAKEAPFIQEYSQNYLKDGSYEYNEENMTFWMVPQEDRSAKMTVKFVNKNDSSMTREFALNVPITWESGHLYRYRINYDGKDMTNIVLGDVNVEDYTPGTTPEVVFD
ncbi:MAG: fimbrillin family protein [Bacteroidales bacterium]|nr:fimbrillin family protein [Bacteroidales bacterium]